MLQWNDDTLHNKGFLASCVGVTEDDISWQQYLKTDVTKEKHSQIESPYMTRVASTCVVVFHSLILRPTFPHYIL